MVENTDNTGAVPFKTRLKIQFAHLDSPALDDAKRAIAFAMAKALGEGVTVDQSGFTVQAGKLVGRAEADVTLTPVSFNGDTIGIDVSTRHPEGNSFEDSDKAWQWRRDQRVNPDWKKVLEKLNFEYEKGPHGVLQPTVTVPEGKFRVERADRPETFQYNIKILVDRKTLLDNIDLSNVNIPVLKHKLKMDEAAKHGVNYHDYLQARGDNDRGR